MSHAILWILPFLVPAPPAAPSAGGWTTGAVGTLGDVVYGPGAHVIDLATTGAYDAAKWVVILDYQTLTVQSGATITFANHPSRAPVVIRAVGPVVIAGTVALDGAAGHSNQVLPVHSEPGPGGFRGGVGGWTPYFTASGGFGPGGGFLPTGDTHGGSGSHATLGTRGLYWGPSGPTYGSPAVLPLIGGSGGGGGAQPGARNGGAGAGGGAILIGSDVSLQITGAILARGGVVGQPYGGKTGGMGSGGAIRLVAPTMTHVGGLLDARGGADSPGNGGHGRIRIETDGDPMFGWNAQPPASESWPLGEFLPDLPAVTVASWWDDDADAWIPIAQDPLARLDAPAQADVQLPVAGVHLVRLEGHDVPLGALLHVRVSRARADALIDSTHTMGEVAGSTLGTSWTDVPIDFSHGVTAVQVRAELP